MSQPRQRVIVAGLVYFEVFVSPSHLEVPPGTERFVDDLHPSIGGAFNTAAVLDALGVPVELVYPRGAGVADAAIGHALSAANLAERPFASAPDPALSIVLRGDNDRAFVSRAKYEELELCPLLPRCAWLHVTGLEEAFRLRRQIEAARSVGTKVSVSGSHAPARLESLGALEGPPWDLLIVNEDEAKIAGGPAARADRLAVLERAARDVIVTCGGRGANGVLAGEAFAVDAVPVEVADATGAGDAFCAGYLAGVINDLGPLGAVELAMEVAARRVQAGALVANDPATYAGLRPPRS